MPNKIEFPFREQMYFYLIIKIIDFSLFRFCVGDRFYLCDNKILCEYDYEERLVFANMAYHPPSIAQLKRQTTQLAVSIFVLFCISFFSFELSLP